MSYRQSLLNRIPVSLRYGLIIFLGIITLLGSANDDLSCEGDECILDDNINGIWVDAEKIAIIGDYGWDVNIIYQLSDMQLTGRILARDEVIYDSVLSLFYSTGSLASVYYNDSGSVTYKGVLDASYTASWSGNVINLHMNYDPGLTERPAALSLLQGSWGYSDSFYSITVNIDNEGLLSGSDSYGCLYNGSFRVPDAMMNIYRINLSVSGCLYMPYGYGQGILMDESVINDTLLFAVSGRVAALASRSIVKRLTRQ